MYRDELEAMNDLHKAFMDQAVKNTIFLLFCPYIAYSIWALALPRKR